MVELARDRTVVVVTHNMQQATRVADKTAFFYLGERLIEEGPTKQLFSQPREAHERLPDRKVQLMLVPRSKYLEAT